MAHRVALYTVRVKERYQDYRLLGDIDQAGTYLLEALDSYLNGFDIQSADGERVLRCVEYEVDNSDLLATMQHGQSGVAADIVDQQGHQRLRQVWTDTQLLRCGCLFRIPQAQDIGWLAAHVNNNRGIKGLLEVGLYDRFRNQFDDLILEIRPFVRASALVEAIDAGLLKKVKLIRYEKPNDRADAATDKWVQSGDFGKLELDISMKSRGKKLKADLIRRFLHGEASAIDDIVEFAGMTFEQAKVEVEIEGTVRTFNIESPTSGHPMTVDLDDLQFDDDGEPSAESVYGALRDALGLVE
jgi:hypothetical protein